MMRPLVIDTPQEHHFFMRPKYLRAYAPHNERLLVVCYYDDANELQFYGFAGRWSVRSLEP